MHNESLVQYIQAVQAQGFPEPAIRAVLAQNGWKATDVEDAFSYLSLSKQAPVPPQAPGAPVIQPGFSVPIQIKETSIQNTASSTHIQYNSAYSIGLALVLFAALLVFVNKIIDDTSSLTTSINQKLIFDAFIIIPFLVVAFILHGVFSENRKKFLIICQPYFGVSAMLLIRLLWDTSSYIWKASATYGVYIVLVMIILVLTGLIIFVRKYMIA